MTAVPAFLFDSSTCTGCKACQVACKDKHNLPVGTNWRRVIEVSGGSWEREGKAWTTDVFTYFISIACNHCEQPVCVDACPAGAITQNAAGVVMIIESRCLGCKYCAWACPFGAPQYSAVKRVMTKCDLCADEVAQGREPACVAACPLRSLASGGVVFGGGLSFAGVWPYVDSDYTKPRSVIKPHPATARANAATSTPAVGRPMSSFPRTEFPLVIYTLCVQAAAGINWVAPFAGLDEFDRIPFLAPLTALLVITGAVASLFHLGKPMHAWRALTNIRTSWLSREILATLLFAAASLVAWSPAIPARIAMSVALLSSLFLVVAMAHAYRLPAQRNWNTRRTLMAFLTASVSLGTAILLLLRAASTANNAPNHAGLLMVASPIFCVLDQLAQPAARTSTNTVSKRVHCALIILITVLSVYAAIGDRSFAIAASIALTAILNAVLNRIDFYRLRVESPS